VGRGEELRWRLAEAGDLRLEGERLGVVEGRALEVDGTLVREVEENVVRLLCRLAPLPVAEDQVDP